VEHFISSFHPFYTHTPPDRKEGLALSNTEPSSVLSKRSFRCLASVCCRLFGARCAKCDVPFAENDLVMRARHKIYHVECFQCVVCQRQLVAGDEFCQRGDEGLFCKADFDAVVECHSDLPTTTAAGFSLEDIAQDLKLHNNNNNNNGEGDAKR